MTWSKNIITKLIDKVKKGTQFFIGHENDNSHENRESVGRILNSIIKEVKGKLSNIVIGYFPEKEKVETLDICSMEADIEIDDSNTVTGIDTITGIALGSSDIDSPAFSGAFRLNAIQCFAKEKEDKDKPGEGVKTMTFEELKKALREMNVHPWQIFTVDDLKNDKVFGKIFDEQKVLTEKYTELETKHKELETKNMEAVKNLNKSKSKDMLESALKDGYTDKQKEFINKRFNPDSLDEINEKTIADYVENAKKEYADTAKLFGIVEDKEKKGIKKEDEEKTPEQEALELMGVKE